MVLFLCLKIYKNLKMMSYHITIQITLFWFFKKNFFKKQLVIIKIIKIINI